MPVLITASWLGRCLFRWGIEENPSTDPLGRASCRGSRSSPVPSLSDTDGGRFRTVSLCVARPR